MLTVVAGAFDGFRHRKTRYRGLAKNSTQMFAAYNWQRKVYRKEAWVERFRRPQSVQAVKNW